MAAKINLRVTSDFAQAEADLKGFGQLSERERQKVERFQAAFEGESLDRFTDRNRRAAAAVTATSGKLAGMQTEYRGLQREIQRLIRRGLDPQDDALRPLIMRYQQLEREIQSSSQAAQQSTRRFSLLDGVMVGLGARALDMAVDAFRQLSRFVLESAQYASDAEETFSKFNVVFRDIGEDASGAMRNLAESFDLADSTAARLLGNTGDLLTGFGLTQSEALELSDATTRLAIDLASFTNAQGGAEAVSRALTSAYAGEREALKTYGIVLNEAMVQSRMLANEQAGLTFESEQQAEIFATLQLAQEQSINAIGDYARTSESAANVQRRLGEEVTRFRENLGETVQRGLTPFREGLADLLDGFNDVTDRSQRLREAINAFRDEGVGAFESTEIGDLNIQLDDLQQRLGRLRAQGGDEARLIREQIAAIQEQVIARRDLARAQALNFVGTQAEREAAERAARQAEERAELDRIALAERLRIRDQYEEAVVTAGMTSLQRIERARQQALDEAASQYVRSGEEISFINQFYDAQRAGELERISAENAERLDEGLAVVRSTLAAESEARLAALELQLNAEDAAAAERKKLAMQTANAVLSSVAQLSNAVIGLYQAQSAAAIEAIDRQTRAQLEAAGLAEETKIESLQRELAAAVAAGDDETAAQKRQALDRERILEAAERRKAQVQYDYALAQWELQRLSAIATGAQAVLNALATQPFPLGLALAGVAGVASGIQLAAINAARPQPPTAQTGTGPSGIVVPETGGRADSVAVMASPGERVMVEPRGGGMGTMNIRVDIDRQTLINITNRAIESGEIRITTRNIQGGVAA